MYSQYPEYRDGTPEVQYELEVLRSLGMPVSVEGQFGRYPSDTLLNCLAPIFHVFPGDIGVVDGIIGDSLANGLSVSIEEVLEGSDQYKIYSKLAKLGEVRVAAESSHMYSDVEHQVLPVLVVTFHLTDKGAKRLGYSSGVVHTRCS